MGHLVPRMHITNFTVKMPNIHYLPVHQSISISAQSSYTHYT